MIRKFALAFAVALVLFFLVFPQREAIVSVFQMSEEPVVIAKGNYGQSIIIEVSFSHDGFLEWLNSIKQPYPLIMASADWIERSSKYMDIIKKKNIPIGLLGGEGAKDYTTELFNKDLAIYEKYLENKPLWFMTSDYNYTEELKQTIFNEHVNMLTPSVIYIEGENFKSEKGDIISIPLHENSSSNFESISKFLNSQKFVSIEENIFGYSIKSKKMPE
ncbi:hypothetical protein [Ureibacillus manganicus]|uniref:Uncharacterized protein n=1 Tax=Ureibacillus manganicus DSM 26584 TaxID=1384049 RepID=A0A0A3I4E9_9BACL|nr:hypothetical protein [Ureibacillus manganicus]KGR79681.1 hypothetical protein CD29_03885 [Ureibacillus manganicus DSM 26584]